MSRVSKYLKQKCSYESLQLDENGDVKLNKYGEPLYEAPVIIKCRREINIQDVQTSTGAIMKSTTRYFTDDTHTIKANDKIDNKIVLRIKEYVNQNGLTEGFESYV